MKKKEKMKALLLYGKNDLRYEEYALPEAGNSEILVKVKAAGICGSDIPRVLEGKAHFYPIILGHEFSGEVVETGPDVKNIKVGDRVAGIPLLPCHKCNDCLKGDYSQCRDYSFIGSRINGAFAEYISLPERNALKFDPSLSFDQGAFFEPSAVALHGISCVQYRGGEDVAVLGGGTIGIFTAQWAKIFGARRVFIFDIDEHRLHIAQKLGIDITVNTLDENFIESVMEYTSGRGFGFVFETAGVAATMKTAFEIAGNKSSVCFIGTPSKKLSFEAEEFEKMNRKEFLLTGSWMSYSAPFPGREWELTAQYFMEGRLKFDRELIFKKIHMKKAEKVFNMYKTHGSIKGRIVLFN